VVTEAVSTPVLSDPVEPRAPLQSPEAVQLVALLLDQLSVALAPEVTVEGEAERLTTGAGGGATLTVADWLTLPPGPVQVSV
jgi:hypothetical protein